MAIVAPWFAFIGRQIGRSVQMAFGWATVLLFGRVPQSKQLLLAAVSLGAIVWVVALIGVVFPDVEEREVLYRQRLQVERDLLRSSRAPAQVDKDPGLIERSVEGVVNLGG